MSKIKFLWLIIFLITQSLNAQTFQSGNADRLVKGSKLVRLNPKTKKVQYIQLRDDAKAEEKNQKAWLGKALSISKNHAFIKLSGSTDKINFTHTKYQLHYKNIPVEGAVYTVHSKTGKISSASGEYSPGNYISEIPSVKESEAFDAAINFVNARLYRWETEKTNRPQGTLVILTFEEKYVLAYKYDIYAFKPLSRQYIFIDANSGKVLKTLNRIQETNADGTAGTLYNGTVSITTDSYSGYFRLRETGRGDGIETYDLNKGTNYATDDDFTDDDNIWNASTNYGKAPYDVHYATEATYDYYYQKFGRNSYDSTGGKIRNYVHFGQNYSGAFWNGEFMTYGDGDGVNYLPFTSIDIVAHEITHGVTEKSAGLVYQGEPGALNESFSDIFGIAVDFFKNPSTSDYEFGDFVSVTHTPFRDMSNPNVSGSPDTYKGLYWDPNQEIHRNSGVQNFWYYLLCEGGTGTNDIGDRYNVTAIGMEKAANIAYRALTVYLNPNSNYTDARFYSIQAARDLFGECSSEVADVASAWYAVGIGDANDCLSPENFTATLTGSSQITLNWKKNIDNNNILLAYSTSINLGNPDDGSVYSPGSLIPGGGVVIYSGDANNFNHTGLTPRTKYYYKAWSIKSGNSYSGGVSATVIPPTINAGEDQKIVLPLKSEVNLFGQYPDGLPVDSLTFKWEKIRGKGEVIFDNSSSLNTIAHFNEVGKSTIQLTIKYFGISVIDSMHVIVSLTDSIANHIFKGYNNWIGLEVKDNYAYLADLVHGFRIMDISDRENPIEISGYEKFNVTYVHVEGDHAYLSQSFGGGLTILNIKDKYHPVFEGYFDIPNSTENFDFVVKHGIVYFTSNPEGIIVIDATDPSRPVKTGGFPCSPKNIALIDNYLYISESGNSILRPFILDISDPVNIKKVASFPDIYGEYLAPNAIQGEYFYRCEQTIAGKNYLKIYNISDRLNPQLTGSTEISWNNSSIFIQGNYAYLNDGLSVIDISDKSHPVEVSNEYAVAFAMVSVQKNYIYCIRNGEFKIYKSYLSNTVPYVYAGFDSVVDSTHYKAKGEVYDDGLPIGLTVSCTWTKVTGPGTVWFSDVNNLQTYIAFSDTGKYVIRLNASDGELLSYDEVMYNAPFAISKQPADQTVCENSQIDFYVEAKSKTPVSYQWYKDSVPLTDNDNITGSKTGRLIIQTAIIQDIGNYYCELSNGNVFLSNKAKLSVNQIPNAAGTITGTASVCKGSAIEIYNIPVIAGATSYIWTLPTGATGTSTTNSIPVSFGSITVSGSLQVKGHNECGDGAESTFAVIVNDLPVTPVITINNSALQSSAQLGNQWYFNTSIINDAINNTYIPLQKGDYFVIVSINGCASQPSNIISLNQRGIDGAWSFLDLNIYPNPTTGIIKITINNKFNSDYFVEVYNNIGIILQILKKDKSEINFEIDLGKFPGGFYMLRISDKNKKYLIKVIKK